MAHTFASRTAWPRFLSPEPPTCLRAGRSSTTASLLALGSRSRVQILSIRAGSFDDDQEEEEEGLFAGGGARLARAELLMQFDQLEAGVCAIAWSPVAVGPLPGPSRRGAGGAAAAAREEDEDGIERIELAVALENGEVYILSASGGRRNTISLGRVTGRVNSLDWLNVSDESHIAAAQADGTLTIWTLTPRDDEDDQQGGSGNEDDHELATFHQSRRTFIYPTPLQTAHFHPAATGSLLILDTTGTLRLLDWSDPALPLDHDPTTTTSASWTGVSSRKPKAVQTFVDPLARARARTVGGRLGVSSLGQLASSSSSSGGSTSGTVGPGPVAGASWKSQDENVLGALIEGRWSIWDVRASAGAGLPVEQGEVYQERSGGGFKWCPTNAQLFLTFSTAPKAAPAAGSSSGRPGASTITGGVGGFGMDGDDHPITIFDRSSLTLSTPRRIARTALLPFEIRSTGLWHGELPAASGGGVGNVVGGERLRDVEWIGHSLGGGLGGAGPGVGAGAGAGAGLGDVIAVAMGSEVVFITLAFLRT
ncbi:hypothetical protein V8E36_004955 [Tilletia maclaganii]